MDEGDRIGELMEERGDEEGGRGKKDEEGCLEGSGGDGTSKKNLPQVRSIHFHL
jgi:hypothetical protein